MCGIGGVLALGDRPPDPAWGALLVGAMAHRGPDGSGIYADHRVVLAHRRLAIIDTGPGGAQPMTAANGRHVIVQNGEVYNYREVKPALERRGVGWRTGSDTEVLLEATALDGAAALEPLRGMWAFALYDREDGSLLLARDRLGKKPLLWVRTPEYFAFASEAAALLALPFVRARLDPEALRAYLTWLYVPAPRTLLEGVHKLPAGSWAQVSRERPAPEPVRYWRPPDPDPDARPDRAWQDGLDRELLEAARLRTVSDVPIGVFLSGGIDSNVVLEALHRGGHRPLRTFTLGFAGAADERPLAALGAQRFADDHVELVVTPEPADLAAALGRFGEPLGDSAVVTTWLIAREAAQHVKVIVNGDGGDELFGGYPRYPFARRADLLRRAGGALALLERRYGHHPNAAAALAALRASDPARAAALLGGLGPPGELDALLQPAFRDAAWAAPPLPGATGPDLTAALFAWDTGVYLPDDLLVKVDVASMAHGLENRSPLLDHRLLEHVWRLPAARRVGPLRTKPLLRRHARGRIPAPLLAAPKRGFQLPIETWLRGPLRGWLGELLGEGAVVAPLFLRGAIARELACFDAGRAGVAAPYRLWAIAALEVWARAFDVTVCP